MATETHEAVVNRLFDAWRRQDAAPEVFAEVFAPGFVCHGPPGVNHTHDAGHENCIFYIFKNCFEEMRFDVTRLSVEGNRAVAHFTVRGKQVEPFRGIPPREQEAVFEGVTILRIEDGKVAEGWGSLSWD